MMKHVIAVGMAATLLAGCATTDPEKVNQLAQQVPPDYRSQIVAHVRATLRDPYSIRDAQISQPTSSFVGLANGGDVPGVCIKLNAKNAFGAYTGVKVMTVAFRNGRVFGMGEPVFTTCVDAVWTPFPELEQTG